jgi:fido (protein-threonine AMPylation protein)
MESLERSLHLTYRLSPESQRLVAEWDRSMAAEPPPLRIRWHLYLRRYLRSATVAASTQIEGNSMSLPEVDALLHGEAVEAPFAQRQENLNLNVALSTATSLAVVPSFGWNEAILRMLNHQILRDLPEDRQGYYREGPVSVGSYSPPDHHAVPQLMTALTQWLTSCQDHVLVRVALLHLNLAAIHPWIDGNGRTARVASALELMRSRVGAPEVISVEPYLRQHQNEYFDMLATTLGPTYRPEEHIATPWVEYYIRISVERLSFDGRMDDAWPHDFGTVADALGAMQAPPEWAPILIMAAIYPIRTRFIAEVIGRSMPTARSVLGEMTRAGWLIARGERRGRFYEAGPRLHALPLRSPEIVARYVGGQTLGLDAA